MTRHVRAANSDACSFIVRLWREDEPGRAGRWRGQVVSVPAGERAYAGAVDELPALLARQMGRAGIRLGWTWRLRIMLHSWRRAWRGQK